MRKLLNLEPHTVFEYFEDICSIPHGSGNTYEISEYCVNFAKEHNLWYYRDGLNNVIIKKPGKGNPVILQGHLDMVCEKTADSSIDFEKDGLDIYADGDLIRARGTTLGADDGIAIAFILAVLASEDIEHPPIEAVFTVDEETGMFGAYGLDTSKLSSKTILNIDSEEEGVFTAGCAGGIRVEARIPAVYKKRNGILHRIELSGLLGGHSGTEIDKNRANANKLLGEILYGLKGIYLTAFCGGSKTNAIPSSSYAEFIADEDLSDIICSNSEKQKYSDPDIKVGVSVKGEAVCTAAENTADIINFLHICDDGVIKAGKNLPVTSSNLGIAALSENEFTAQFLIRSNINSEKEAAAKSLLNNAVLCGGTAEFGDDYPAWEYSESSPLRGALTQAYRALFNAEPKIVTIHAGLECGIFTEKIPGADCVSIGPDIYDIHTPNEAMSISSAARTWELLKLTLKLLQNTCG